MPANTVQTQEVSSWRTYGLLSVIVLTLGGNWPVQAAGLQVLSPLWMASFRLLIALVAMSAIAAVRGELRSPSRRDLPIVWSVGLFRLAAVFLLIFSGLQIVPPGRSSVVVWTQSLWTVPLAAVFLRERMTPIRWVGLLAGLTGIVVLFEPWRQVSSATAGGHLLLILAAVITAATAVHVRSHGWTSTPLALMPWQLLVAMAAVGSLAIGIEGWPAIAWTPSLVLILLYQGLLATSVAVWAQQTVLQRLPATSTNLTLMAVPVVGLLSSVAFAGERLTLPTVAALLLILAGVGANIRADISTREEPIPVTGT